MCAGYMHDLSEANPHVFSFRFNVSCDVSLSYPFDGVIPECLDVLAFVVFAVQSEDVSIEADMNSFS